MNTETYLKTLWNKEKAPVMPEAEALLKKAARLRQLFRLKLIIQTSSLTIIIVVILIAGLKIGHRQMTTTAGLVLMLLGIVSYLITTNQLLPMLLKRGIVESSQEYLRQLILIQQKNEFLQRVMIDIYFILLSTGLYLYLLQFVRQMGTFKAVLCYLIPSIGMAIAWSYSKRREFNKTSAPLKDTIKKLEEVSAQFLDS